MSKFNNQFSERNIEFSYSNDIDNDQLQDASRSFPTNEKIKLVRRIAATVAHEISNPVTSIKDLVHLLTMGRSNPEYYATIYDEINKIEEVVNGLSKLGERQSINFRLHDMGLILERTIMTMKNIALFKDIKIISRIEGDLSIYCDDVQLHKVFEIIIKNAIEASAHNEKVYVTCRTNDFYIHIRIKDQGVGIPAEKMKHLFEPFYCIKETGPDFSLMISHKIIKEHNGIIQVTSKVEVGTTVDIYIPLFNS